jgi:PadR family transcriptional regulator PadR
MSVLQVQHGSLYPALHRLERKRWVTSKWEAAPDRNREFNYYRLTASGEEQLLCRRIEVESVAEIRWPAVEN